MVAFNGSAWSCSIGYVAVAMIAVLLDVAVADQIAATMYTPLTQAPGCVQLLNNNGEIGCKTKASGATGPILSLLADEDYALFLVDPPSVASAVIIPVTKFTPDDLTALSKTGKIAGVFVSVPESGPAAGFSPAPVHTQETCGGAPAPPWNPLGSGMVLEKYDFPIVEINATQTDMLSEHSRANSERGVYEGGYPQHVAEFSFRMDGVTNSMNCLKTTSCLPVGGYNVWSVAGEPLKEGKPIVLAVTTLDSNSMFHDDVPGAVADVSGTVALLGAAHALYGRNEVRSASKTLVFTWLTGQSYGEVGARAFVHNAKNFQCVEGKMKKLNGGYCTEPYLLSPQIAEFDMSNVDFVLEVDQVDGDSAFLHSGCSPTAHTTTVATDLTQGHPMLAAATPGALPPSALDVFATEFPALQGGAVMTGYDRQFNNKYYHSVFDKVASVSGICASADILAVSLFKLTTGTVAPADFKVNCTLVEEYYKAFMNDRSGVYTDKLYGAANPGYAEVPPSQYAGVYRPWGVNAQSAFIADAMAHAAVGDVVVNDAPECNGDNGYKCPEDSQRCSWGRCIAAPSFFMDAVSPGVKYSLTDEMFLVVNESVPIWTESNWPNGQGVKLYERDSTGTEVLVFFVGVICTGAAIAATLYGERLYERKFKNRAD